VVEERFGVTDLKAHPVLTLHPKVVADRTINALLSASRAVSFIPIPACEERGGTAIVIGLVGQPEN